MKMQFVIVLAFLISLAPNFALAKDYFEGRVVSVIDGDTIIVLDQNKTEIKVRLISIDAPEKEQPFGEKAKQMLSDLCFNWPVVVKTTSKDQYGRVLGQVYLRDVEITDGNAEMVKRGGAWVYRRYSTDASLLKLEEEARIEKRGLWALQEDQRIPPWEWRRKPHE